MSEMTRDELVDLHEELCGKARTLMRKKNTDYTGGGGPFANFDSSNNLNVHRVKGALIRLQDKLQRINSFIERGVLEVDDESVEDTIIDAINYPVLIAGMIREEKS
jgi:hypothetical protein